MPELEYSSRTKKKLTDPLQPVYILYGEDNVLKKEAFSQLYDAIVLPDFADFDYEAIDAETTAPEDILSSACMAPFSSPRKVVLVKGAEIFKRRDRSKQAEVIAAGIEKLGDYSCLILQVEAEEKQGKTAITTAIDNAVKKKGLLVRCKLMKEEEIAHWLVELAQKAGKRLDWEAAVKLVSSAPTDRIALRNELEKAICFAGDRQVITLEDADEICSKNPEDVIFRLVDAVADKNAANALRLLKELLRYDSRIQGAAGKLIALLNRQLKLLYQAKELKAAGIHAGNLSLIENDAAKKDILQALPSDASILKMKWKARSIYAQADKWSRPALVDAFDKLRSCDLANKGDEQGNEDVLTNLEILIHRLCSSN
jgi:DNA polymerase-3 subunit delta